MPSPSTHSTPAVVARMLPILLAWMTGCYDPVVSVNPDEPIGQDGRPVGGPGPGPGGSPDGGPGNPNENNHHSSQFIVEDGEGITLSGTVSSEESLTGQVQLDFLQLDASGARTLVHATSVAGVGDWSELVPKGFGEVYIMAFADNDRNGPSEHDPKAVAGPITVGDENVEGIDLTLQMHADLGALSLSTMGEAPSGSAPPGGDPNVSSEPPSGSRPPGDAPSPQPPPDGAAPAPSGPADAPTSTPKPGPTGEVGEVREGATAEDTP